MTGILLAPVDGPYHKLHPTGQVLFENLVSSPNQRQRRELSQKPPYNGIDGTKALIRTWPKTADAAS
jgi:hypothetical protein